MRKALDYLRTHPIVALAILVGIVGVILLWPRSQPPAPVVQPAPPGPAPSPAVPSPGAPPPSAGPQPTPSPAAAPPPRAAAAPPADAGRPDPFAPLVRPEAGGVQPGLPAPPPAPLPPPLFPGQTPAAPEPAATPPPPKEASGARLVGIVGETSGVAIVRIGEQTYIVATGDVILNKIRVTVVDVLKGLVVLEQEGERFELKLGGVSAPHVAVTASSGIS
ncbi:MAG: hypothetical protein QN187_02940 [Armatimonadota bacterium]|nr:hypothetical protein [Armatimonadota bacterium]MDR7519435.1 hypothetical protein [Armatimonadota bacterium]MDR7549873.1 hypothetical protein [Armatimonadota bacterium]